MERIPEPYASWPVIMSYTEAARRLGVDRKTLSKNKALLIKCSETIGDKQVLMNNNQPYQTYIDRGYFRVVEQKYTIPSGETKISIKTLVYQKGLDYIRRLLQKQSA